MTLLVDVLHFFFKLLAAYVVSLKRAVFQPQMESVSGKIVLITGAGHGIGKELARIYGRLGAEVICVDINEETNIATASELQKEAVKARAYTCDISIRADVLLLAKKIEADIGEVDILINNAGIMPCRKLQRYSAPEIQRVFEINVLAHFWMLEAFLPGMKKRNSGHVVAISSIAGTVGLPNLVPYCASKFAVRGLMESLMEEFRKEGTKIKLTSIYPYMTDTGLCKRPRLKFPNLMKLLPVEETAQAVVCAQRRGCREVSVPQYMLHLNNLVRNMPSACARLTVDFFDSGVDVDDE